MLIDSLPSALLRLVMLFRLPKASVMDFETDALPPALWRWRVLCTRPAGSRNCPIRSAIFIVRRVVASSHDRPRRLCSLSPSAVALRSPSPRHDYSPCFGVQRIKDGARDPGGERRKLRPQRSPMQKSACRYAATAVITRSATTRLGMASSPLLVIPGNPTPKIAA